MGVEYLLIKDDKKEYFDLGKGYWIDIFSYISTSVFLIRDEYKRFKDFQKKILSSFCVGKEEKEYWKKVAEDIYFWCSVDSIRFSNDCIDEDVLKMNQGDLRETGGRFYE